MLVDCRRERIVEKTNYIKILNEIVGFNCSLCERNTIVLFWNLKSLHDLKSGSAKSEVDQWLCDISIGIITSSRMGPAQPEAGRIYYPHQLIKSSRSVRKSVGTYDLRVIEG